LREWHSTQPLSRVKPYLQRLFEATDPAVCVAACRVDGAHYREIDHAGKGANAIKLQKSALF
ncbi:hypothetical protein ONS79_05830, partial [Aeromonas hydrophila subsp. hydrophila]|uniref:hypothetical protein n=1 Tax=Aeromonas hydrophila TaxID=644 RepID=UPI0023EF773F